MWITGSLKARTDNGKTILINPVPEHILATKSIFLTAAQFNKSIAANVSPILVWLINT